MLLSMPARGWKWLVSSPFTSYLLTMVFKVLFFFVFFFLLYFGGVFFKEYWLETICKSSFAGRCLWCLCGYVFKLKEPHLRSLTFVVP